MIIDINCDVGEGVGNESELFQYISSCNIACGGHAGDSRTIREVVKLAKQKGIKIGAHPSYPDKENFGRKTMDLPADEFVKSIGSQIRLFKEILKEEEATLHHIKPHGALYNDLLQNKRLAKSFVGATKPFLEGACYYTPHGSALAKEAELNDLQVINEAFADRNYNQDLSLVSRSMSDALITEPEKVLDHLIPMIKEGTVKTINGAVIPIRAQTFCIHGDTPTALQILMYLAEELPRHHVIIAK